MNTDNSDENDAAMAVLKALDQALQEGEWEETNFLRVIGKKLQDIRDEFVAELELHNMPVAPQDNTNFGHQVGMKEVFVSLYSTEGTQLSSWERIISNLPRQMISRPIYASEDEVNYLIRSKENRNNEAYVGIFIHEADILPLHPDKILRDKFGRTLLNLKDKTLLLTNISRFVHASGTYNYVKGRLIPV